MKKKLTLTAVHSLRKEAEAAQRRIYVYDTDQPKFGAAFHPSGAVTYFDRYRLRGAGRKGTSKRMTIGSGRDLTPERARSLAAESIGLILRGVDVVLQLKEERLKLKEATLKEIAEQYFELEAKPSRHWIDTRAIFERYVFPALGAKPVTTVSKPQIRALLDDVRKWRICRAKAIRGAAAFLSMGGRARNAGTQPVAWHKAAASAASENPLSVAQRNQGFVACHRRGELALPTNLPAVSSNGAKARRGCRNALGRTRS